MGQLCYFFPQYDKRYILKGDNGSPAHLYSRSLIGTFVLNSMLFTSAFIQFREYTVYFPGSDSKPFLSDYDPCSASLSSTLSGPRQANKCLRACTHCADSHHPAHAQGLIRVFARH